MRRPIFALIAATGLAGMPLFACSSTASAQEPLYLKIRPGLPPGLDVDGIAAAQAAAAPYAPSPPTPLSLAGLSLADQR